MYGPNLGIHHNYNFIKHDYSLVIDFDFQFGKCIQSHKQQFYTEKGVNQNIFELNGNYHDITYEKIDNIGTLRFNKNSVLRPYIFNFDSPIRNQIYSPESGNITIETYIKFQTESFTANNVIFEIGDSVVGDLQMLVNSLNQARVQRAGTAGSIIAINQFHWNHIVCTKNSSTVNVWVNGVKGTDYTGSFNNSNRIRIGGQQTIANSINNGCNANMSMFRYYRRLLTQNEIIYNYKLLSRGL
jgi:hypothetical protein